MNNTEYVVVGAGLAGSAIAWELARRGAETTILERFTPANASGSSHGSARIFRYAYPDAFYTRLVQESREGWDEVEKLTGERLITPTGAVDYGGLRNPAALAHVLEQAGIDHELLDVAQARERWPQIAFDTPVLWHPDAGVIDAEHAVAAMVRLAVDGGARLLTGWPVSSIESVASGYRVTAATGETIDAANVIVAAGGWLPDLLGGLPMPAGFLGGFPPLEVRQEQAYHFPYREGGAGWPTFIHKREGMQAYGLPGGRDAGSRGQKVAEYNGGKSMRSAREQDGIIDPANRQRVVDYVERYLPGLIPEPYAETTCLFTNTPTEDFVIDRVDGVTVVSPCSGHGAKFAPMIGRLAADLATGAGTVPERFRIPAAV